jgi:WD40-like Beta Propeller Repeat
MTVHSSRRPGLLLGVALWVAGFTAVSLAFPAKPEPGAGPTDPLAPWKARVRISVISPGEHHSIHSYFNTSPESPDGRRVLFYTSTTAAGHQGEIRVRERTTGRETILARGVAVEDAHRAACQQWVSGGQRVAFHNVLKAGEWIVTVVDLSTGKERILARGRQLGFGQPAHDLVPLYGPHWAPGAHRGLELLNVATGEVRQTNLTVDAVRKAYPEWVKKQFADRPISVFFPLLSPDLQRVIFKVATPAGGDFRSKKASERYGLLCYDLGRSEFRFLHGKWGHPAWHPNGRDILNVGGRVTDSDTGKERRLPGTWPFPGSHPSYSPDGRLFTTDTLASSDPFNGPRGTWAVVVGDVRTGQFVTLHRFDNSRGARSWRVSHPHPAFSPDGKRVYFNVSDGKWTRLHVAEVGP